MSDRPAATTPEVATHEIIAQIETYPGKREVRIVRQTVGGTSIFHLAVVAKNEGKWIPTDDKLILLGPELDMVGKQLRKIAKRERRKQHGRTDP